MANPKTSQSVPSDPEKWRTEQVAASALRVGDFIHLYGTEVGRVTAVSEEKPETALVYEWKDRSYTGLKPGKAGAKVTRILV
jgi:ABC-type transporter Mla subunit MlaD